MKIEDWCSCGAHIEVNSRFNADAAKLWAGWLTAHNKCRGDNREIYVKGTENED